MEINEQVFSDERLQEIVKGNPNHRLTDRLLAQLILEAREQKEILEVIKNKYLESL